MAEWYTTPFSITSQFAFCGLPLRLDTYRGCAFRCTYCFARYRGGNTPAESVRPAEPSVITSTVDRAMDGTSNGVLAQFIQRRTPIHLGGMTDPLQPAEQRHRITAMVLKALNERRYPVVLSTRSSLIGEPPYLDMAREGGAVVQLSFSTLDDERARRVEPHCEPPSRLLRVMEKLAHGGVPVTGRWQPYIPRFSGARGDFIRRPASAGCRHVAVEHLKLPVERGHPLWQQLIEGIGRDLLEEYRRAGAKRDGREMVLPAAKKLAFLLKVRALAVQNRMSFGGADNELQYLSTTGCCCSGVDQFPGFQNWFRHQIAYAVRKSDGGPITYDLIEQEWAPEGSLDRYLNSRSRLSLQTGQAGTLRRHILEKWNHPERPGSPAGFYGVEAAPEAKSDPIVYRWSDGAPVARLGSRSAMACATRNGTG
jgi:DNA repair photolyase